MTGGAALAALVLPPLLAVPAAVAVESPSPSPPSSHAVSGEWTGYLTDSHCGRHCANEHLTAAALEKSLKGGATLQLWSEDEEKLYTLDGLEKTAALAGKRITIRGSLDPDTGTVLVRTADETTVRREP
jgi:hypothetical protein